MYLVVILTLIYNICSAIPKYDGKGVGCETFKVCPP